MHMHGRRLIAGLLLAIATAFVATLAEAQVLPSSYTPVGICSLFSGPLAANSTLHLRVRGSCGIPETANAVTLIAATTGSAANGALYAWDSGILQPGIPSMFYRVAPGGDSSTLVVRLCYPFLECSDVSMSARLTASAFLTLSAVGYFEPFPSE